MSSPPSLPRWKDAGVQSPPTLLLWSEQLPDLGALRPAGEEGVGGGSFRLGLPPALRVFIDEIAPSVRTAKSHRRVARCSDRVAQGALPIGRRAARSFLQQVVTQIQQPRKTGVVGRLVLKTRCSARRTSTRSATPDAARRRRRALPGLGEVQCAAGARRRSAEHVTAARRATCADAAPHALGKGQTSLETADGALEARCHTPRLDKKLGAPRPRHRARSSNRRCRLLLRLARKRVAKAAAAVRLTQPGDIAANSPRHRCRSAANVGGGKSIWGSARVPPKGGRVVSLKKLEPSITRACGCASSILENREAGGVVLLGVVKLATGAPCWPTRMDAKKSDTWIHTCGLFKIDSAKCAHFVYSRRARAAVAAKAVENVPVRIGLIAAASPIGVYRREVASATAPINAFERHKLALRGTDDRRESACAARRRHLCHALGRTYFPASQFSTLRRRVGRREVRPRSGSRLRVPSPCLFFQRLLRWRESSSSSVRR